MAKRKTNTTPEFEGTSAQGIIDWFSLTSDEMGGGADLDPVTMQALIGVMTRLGQYNTLLSAARRVVRETPSPTGAQRREAKRLAREAGDWSALDVIDEVDEALEVASDTIKKYDAAGEFMAPALRNARYALGQAVGVEFPRRKKDNS